MDPNQAALYERLAETIRRAILRDPSSEFGIVREQHPTGPDQVGLLENRLAELQARVARGAIDTVFMYFQRTVR